MDSTEQLMPTWGRLLIAGGTDFATLGRKDKSGRAVVNDDRPDLPSAHIMRNVANVKFKSVFTTHSGCHAVAIDIDHHAYLFGRNENHQLSHPLPEHLTTPFETSEGVLSPTPAAPLPFPLDALPAANVPRRLKAQGIKSAALGRGHTVLVTVEGEAWIAGQNNLGQCAQSACDKVSSFTRVMGPLANEKVVQASCGITFTLFLTESGRVYSCGSGEHGQLGNGKTGEYIAASKVFFTVETEPTLIGGPLIGKKIVKITSGQQHSVALDEAGYCYAWGFGGLGRLGLSAQFDCLLPTVIPHFAGANVLTRVRDVVAGPGNTLFIDRQGMVSLCGRWKTSGDGSSGQPWMTPKLVQDIMGYKWKKITSGGVTLFATTFDPKEGDFVVGWGQGASCGELALGAGAVKSATKPTRIEGLDGIQILDIAAGQNTTFLIGRPPSTAAERAHYGVDETVPVVAVVVAPVVVKKPGGVDLSGFGFSYTPPPPTPAEILAKEALENRAHASRTIQEQWEELLRYPVVEDASEVCLVCRIDGGLDEDAEVLECEMCENAFHGRCLSPPIEGVPDGEWFCPSCDKLPEKYDDGEEDETAEGKKRKAQGTTAPVKKRK